MSSKMVKAISGVVGFVTLAVFILGLAHSISTGFAGFWGGFPFAVIAVFVLCLAAYDAWDSCLRGKNQNGNGPRNGSTVAEDPAEAATLEG